MSAIEETKECPLCAASWGPPQTEQAPNGGRWQVGCMNPRCGARSGWGDSEAEAIALWNTRPAPPKSSLILNAHMLREALEFCNPDGNGDPDQMNTELTFKELTAEEAAKMVSEGEEGHPYPAGVYCWMTEYPEEGCLGPLGMIWTQDQWIKVET